MFLDPDPELFPGSGTLKKAGCGSEINHSDSTHGFYNCSATSDGIIGTNMMHRQKNPKTKHPKTKHPKTKRPKGQKVLRAKRPKGQNVPRGQMRPII